MGTEQSSSRTVQEALSRASRRPHRDALHEKATADPDELRRTMVTWGYLLYGL